MRYTVFMCLLILAPFFGFSQSAAENRRSERKERINEMMRQQEEGVINFEKSFAFGVKLTNDGYGGFLELGRAHSIRKSTLYQLEFSERKSHKENKQSSGNPYGVSLIYGKENFFYPVRLGVQQQLLLGNKSNKNGVFVTANYGGGLTVGLLRPYYAQVLDGRGGTKYVKYDSPDSLSFLDYGVLIGGPSFGKGWNEMSVVPGVYGKAALRFDYGRFNELISAIEVGITADIYSKKIPQMVYAKEQQFFFGGYVSILFGRRK